MQVFTSTEVPKNATLLLKCLLRTAKIVVLPLQFSDITKKMAAQPVFYRQ